MAALSSQNILIASAHDTARQIFRQYKAIAIFPYRSAAFQQIFATESSAAQPLR